MASSVRAPNDQPTLEGAPNEAGASVEEGIPVGGPPNVDEIGEKAPSRVATTPMFPSRLADTEPSSKKMSDRLLLSMYVPPHERIHPPMGMVATDLEGALESSTVGTPSTKWSLRLRTCATFIPIIFAYL